MTMMKKLMYMLGSFVGLILGFIIFAQTAHAATFTVTDTGDAAAVDPSVSCDTAGDVCTLRSAIEAANAQAGADTIDFNISGGGVHTITPASALPSIIEQLTIDGSTQPGASCGTLVPTSLPGSSTPHTLLIEIDGSSTGGSTLTVDTDASGSTLKGLIINHPADNFSSVYIAGGNPGYTVQINCNYLGTDSTGNTAQTPSESDGITGYLVGGVIENNLVSGYQSVGGQGNGIALNGDGFTVQNNLIGTTSDGISSLPNKIGIWLLSGNSQASPATSIDHNIISGNQTIGIMIGQETYSGNNPVITGNYIGLNLNADALGNGGDGIYSISASGFVIGGTTSADRNVISANQGNGIHIFSQGDDGSGCQNSSDGTIQGNYVGTNVAGEVADGMGNQQSGITFNEVDINCSHGTINSQLVGGDGAGQANIIAGNTLDGVRIYQVPNTGADVYGISVLANSIFGNGNLGINLAADSTGSGVADTDLGPNVINDFLMSYPATNANYYINHSTINSATYIGNQLTVNYNFQANGVEESGDGVSLLPTDLVGYRLDFYLNQNTQDGAYAGYAQGKTHIGSFIVDGSEAGATHVFTSPVSLGANQNVTATATVLWTTNPDGGREGTGPPYQNSK